MKHYIFGYGSLINRKSRLRTAETSKAIPVKVKGLQRAWNYHNPERKRNVLGVIVDAKAVCNGVIFAVSEEALAEFDKRESEYDREELDSKDFTLLGRGVLEEIIPESKIWVYIPQEPKFPTASSPIQQSYVDVVIAGCLEIGEELGIGEEFAVEMIKTTIYWDGPWVDDRNNPGYYGTIKGLPIEKIDRILKKVILEEFGKRIKRY